jgi:lipopolysaccharide export system permease protein
MTRLSAYLTRLFAADAMALFGVALFLLFLVQCLRTFDVVSVKGQDILTLVGQALLSMPTLGVVFLYVCLAIGLGRGLRALQMSQELHIIHVSQRSPALLTAIAAFIGMGMAGVLLLSNFIEPATNRQFNDWSAQVAADLVGRALTPHRFVEVVPGVTMLIGDRLPGGELREFFADDHRNPETRRTYIAESALITTDNEGYVLQLRDGAIQYMSDDLQFSRVSFARYDVAMERLTGPTGSRDVLGETNSFSLVAQMLARGAWDERAARELGERLGEAVRLAALSLFVAALAAFPHSRRAGREVPIEIVILAMAFIERGVSSYVQPGWLLTPVSGSYMLIALSIVVLLLRFRAYTPVRREEVAA